MHTGHHPLPRLILLLAGVACAILASGMFHIVYADELPGVRQRFVPADRPDLWPAAGENDWVPLSKPEFDRLLGQVRSLSETGRTIPFNTAVYEATFEPRTLSLTQGTATLEVSPGQAPGRLIPCSPLNLSIGEPRWQDNGRPAVLGATAGGGHYLAVPPASRNLRFDWQLTGIRRLSGAEFSIRIPTAVASTLSLEVPLNWMLTATSGTVTRNRSDRNRTVWQLDLGRRTETRLRLIDPGQNSSNQKTELTTASLSSRFELAPLVVESATEVSFESLLPGERSLEFQIGEDWQIRSVERASGGAVLWQDLGLADGRRRLRIEIPDGATAGERGFVVNSSLPIRAGNKLDLAAPQLANAVLFDGRLQIAMGPPFTLQDYSTVGLSQTDVSVESGQSGRTLLSFQQFAPEARVSLSLRDDVSSRNRSLTVRQFSVGRFDMNPPEFHADLQLTSRSREVFSLDTWIPAGWEVTRITLRDPAGLQVELPWQTIQSSSDGPDRVRIRLPDGLETSRSALLQISAQYITWSRGSAIALPAVFPEINGLTSVTAGLLFRSDAPAATVTVEGFDSIDRDVALSRSAWSTLAGDLAERPVQMHTVDYWENAGNLASLSVRQQGTSNQSGNNPSATDLNTPSTSSTPVKSNKSSANLNSGEANTVRDGSTMVASSNEAETAVSQPVVSSHLESFIAPGPGGRDLHRMSWKFAYAAPERSVQLTLPRDAVLLETLWNDQPLAASPEGDHWTIPVPRVSAGDTLAVRYTLRSKDIYLRDTRRVQLPSFDAISASFEWELHLRKGYAAVSMSEEMTRLDAGRPAGWLRWFFGPLARSSAADWFNPLSSTSWRDLFQNSTSTSDREQTTTGKDAIPAGRQPSLRDWTTVRSVSGVVPRTLSVHLCRVDRLHALAWFVLVTTCLVGVVLRTLKVGSRNRIGLLWLSGCLAAAVIVPDRYAELIGAAILGTVIATLLPRSLIRPQPREDGDVSYPTMASTIALPRAKVSELLRLLLITGVLLGAASAGAQNSEPTVPEVIEVLVPYQGDRFDNSAKPPEVVYLDAGVLRQLQQSAETVTVAPTVLLTGTEWDAIVDRNDRSSVQGRLLIAVSPESGSMIEVPVPASLVDPETPVLLDGRPVSALPGFDGGSLLIANPDSNQSSGDAATIDRINAAETDDVPPPASGPEVEATTGKEPTQQSTATQGANPRPRAPSLPERDSGSASEPASDGASEPGTEPSQSENRQPTPTASADQDSIGNRTAGWKLHTLELRLRPEIRIDVDIRRFELPVSPVARSRFRLKFEVPPASIRESSTGTPIGALEDGAIEIQPGPVSDIALEWSTGSTQSVSRSVRAAVRSAAEIYPGRILRQTLAVCVPEDGSSIGRLAWKLPPHVQLDRQQIRASRLVDMVMQRHADHSLAVLEFDPPHTESFTIQMNWQQITSDSSGTAAIQWEVPVAPESLPLRVTVETYLAGVKAAPGFRLANELLQSLEQSRISTDSFLELWPEKSRPRSPQIAFRIPERDRPDVPAQIVPVQPQRAVRQNLEARLSPSRIRWSVSAEIEISNAPAFLHELTIPEAVRIDSVSLQQDEVDRLSHWERRGDRLVLFLKDRSTGIQTVTIEGRQEFDRQQPVTVPRVSVTGAQVLASTLQVYSQPGFRPIISGAEPVDSLAESRLPAASGYVGEYRLATGNEVAIELQAVTEQHPLRWLGILDLLADDSVQVELAIAVSAREPGEWQINLPNWTSENAEILSIDGMLNVSSSESLAATIADRTLLLTVSAPIPDASEVRLRLPVDPSLLDGTDGERSLLLTPPTCELEPQIPSAIVSRQGSSQLKMTGQLISDQQHQQLDSLLDGTLQSSAVLTWDSTNEVTTEAQSVSVLPTIVLHSVRCGGRMTQICRTRVLANSDARQLQIRWPASIEEIYRRIDGQLQPTGSPDGKKGIRDAHVEVIDLPDSAAPHHLEFLWKPASTSDRLRIRRETLDFPRVTSDTDAGQFVEIIPAADVKVLPDTPSDQREADRDALLDRLTPWHDYIASHPATPPFHISRTLAAMSRAANNHSALSDPAASNLPGENSNETDLPTTSDSLSDQEFNITEENSQLVLTSSDDEVGVWMVDRRIDHILLGIVVGLAVVLPILKFFSLEFGERLAGRPMLSFALLGLVWWSCLQSSAAGFGVLLIALLLWAGQSVIRRLKSHSDAPLAVH